jgi:RNA polymerase sigma factor (sigma-70 family)
MATSPSGAEEGRDAWATFYGRHRRYLYGVCLRAYGETLGDGRVTELVQDTFVRAYEKAGTFKPDPDGDSVTGRRRARAWLGRISENIVSDYFRREPKVVFMDEDELPEQVDPEESVPSGPSAARLERLERVLAQLSDREQEVLRATAMWYWPGQRQQRLPNSVMTKLAASLSTSADNVRQIRVRAMTKVRKLMEATD